jgi:GntR family transcriptional regulator
MLLSIEPDGPVPIYQQIRDRIIEAIATGTQPAGSGLPATRQLAVDLGVNFHTVNKSYDALRQEGLLRIGRKSGAVVRRDARSGPPDPGWELDWAARLRTLLAEAAAQGLPAAEIIGHCETALAAFDFPSDAAEVADVADVADPADPADFAPEGDS